MDLFLYVGPRADQSTAQLSLTDKMSPRICDTTVIDSKGSPATAQESRPRTLITGKDDRTLPSSNRSSHIRRVVIGGADTHATETQTQPPHNYTESTTPPSRPIPKEHAGSTIDSKQLEQMEPKARIRDTSGTIKNCASHSNLAHSSPRTLSTEVSDSSLPLHGNELTSISPPSRSIYIRSRRHQKVLKAPMIETRLPETPRRQAPSLHGNEIKVSALPTPEIAYSKTFHFTTCPHTSPPRSRPLNAPPSLVTYHQGLLAHPPVNLCNYPLVSAPEIYVIEGACAECDLASRRHAESMVLAKYKSKIEILCGKFDKLQADVDLESANSVDNEPTVIVTREVAQQIVSIEADLDVLIGKRDREVKFVWRGYTRRWGPATLGVHHDQPTLVARRTQTAASKTAMDTVSLPATTDEAISRASTSMSTATECSNSNTSTAVSSASSVTTTSMLHSSRSSSRTREIIKTSLFDTPQSRYSDGSHQVATPPPIDARKQDGRMRLAWVRPDRHRVNSGDAKGKGRDTSPAFEKP